MKRVNMFIVGAPKCGTTAWVEYFATHPEITFSSEKEPHFFNEDMQFRFANNLDEYHERYFSHIQNPTKYVAEASVQYLYSKAALRKIAEYNPDAKIIVCLRRPDEFLASYHQQLVLMFDEDVQDFAQAWALQEDRAQGRNLPETCRDSSMLQYKDEASFGAQLERCFEAFPESQVHVMWFEDWIRNPRGKYLELMEFLGLQDDGREQFEQVHRAKKVRFSRIGKILNRPSPALLACAAVVRKLLGRKRLGVGAALRRANVVHHKNEKFSDALRNEILESLDADLDLLERLTGRNLDHWRAGQMALQS